MAKQSFTMNVEDVEKIVLHYKQKTDIEVFLTPEVKEVTIRGVPPERKPWFTRVISVEHQDDYRFIGCWELAKGSFRGK